MTARTTLLFALGLAACGQGPSPSRVRLDLTAVSTAAILSAGDTLTVRARGAGFEDSVTVDLTAPTFSIDVPSGSLVIEAEADHLDTGTMTAYYFGDAHVSVAPNSTTDVVVPMFPAGAIKVDVIFKPGFVIPGRILVTLTPVTPRTGGSTSFDAELTGGKLDRVLPTGDYTYRVSLSTDGGQTFEGVGPTSSVVTIVQSKVVSFTFDLTNVNF
jgi:hypothetical protein